MELCSEKELFFFICLFLVKMLGIFAQHTGFVAEVPELHAEAKTVYN